MTRRQALNILNPEKNNDDSLKKAYRKACLKHHPDHGGDVEIMKLVNEAFETLQNITWTQCDTRQSQTDDSILEKLMEKWDKVKHFGKISGEIIGTWIWISGETWRYKKVFKAEGFKWSGNKRSWYFNPSPDWKKRSKKRFTMDDIRNSYGSEGLKSETVTPIG